MFLFINLLLFSFVFSAETENINVQTNQEISNLSDVLNSENYEILKSGLKNEFDYIKGESVKTPIPDSLYSLSKSLGIVEGDEQIALENLLIYLSICFLIFLIITSFSMEIPIGNTFSKIVSGIAISLLGIRGGGALLAYNYVYKNLESTASAFTSKKFVYILLGSITLLIISKIISHFLKKAKEETKLDEMKIEGEKIKKAKESIEFDKKLSEIKTGQIDLRKIK